MRTKTRINWKGIMGISLSDYIISLKARKLSKQEVFQYIAHDDKLQDYWRKNPNTRFIMRQRLITSIDARYSENNNAVRRYLNATKGE